MKLLERLFLRWFAIPARESADDENLELARAWLQQLDDRLSLLEARVEVLSRRSVESP